MPKTINITLGNNESVRVVCAHCGGEVWLSCEDFENRGMVVMVGVCRVCSERTERAGFEKGVNASDKEDGDDG